MKEILNKEIDKYDKLTAENERTEIYQRVAEILKSQEKIVIYGAGAAGKSIYEALKKEEIKIDFFVDKRYDEILEYNNCPVKSPECLKTINSVKNLVIVSVDPQMFLNYKREIIEESIAALCPECSIICYGRSILNILKYNQCYKKNKLNITECINCGAESRGCTIFDKYIRKDLKLDDTENVYKSELFNNYFGYILGQACTLKCENCCEMVPYLKEHKFVNKDIVISECKRILKATKFLQYIELVGGEPFLHPEIKEILVQLLAIQNAGYIKVFTNGTVIPDDDLCEILKNDRVVVVLSNYMDVVKGKLLNNINTTREIFEHKKIDYIFSYSKTWLDFKSFEEIEKDEEVLRRDFKDCHIANCNRLYKGVLYRCPHQYAGIQLEQLKLKQEECVNINECELNELGKKLDSFTKLEYIDACMHCAMPYNAKEIPAAKQL